MKLKDTIHDKLPQKLLILVIILLLFFMSAQAINSSWSDVFSDQSYLVNFLNGFARPDFSYIPDLLVPILETLAMSLAGTFFGVILAIPAAFLGTEIVTKNKLVTFIFRTFFSLVRTIPNLLLGAIFVTIIGIGSFTGVVTITIFTFGVVSQWLYAAIENIDLGPLESDEAVGATRFQIALNSVWPQVEFLVWSYSLFAFEINVRASAVLGYVGAGGIGTMLNAQMSLLRYDRVAVIILFILLMVVIIDWITGLIEKEMA